MPISCNQLLYDNLLLLPKAISIAMPIANRNCYQLVIRCFSCIASCLISVSVYMTTFIVIWQPCANLLISWITIYMTTFVVVTDSIHIPGSLFCWSISVMVHCSFLIWLWPSSHSIHDQDDLVLLWSNSLPSSQEYTTYDEIRLVKKGNTWLIVA